MTNVRQLTPAEVARHHDDLAETLAACVAGGAGVGFVLPFTSADARNWWQSILPAINSGERLLFAALDGDRVVGTVQLIPVMHANQPHRADISKMLVHPDARRRGLGEALMLAAEAEARRLGRSLLTLDTVTDSPAQRLYARIGWQVSGTIPNYALSPTRGWDSTTVMWKAL